MNRLRTSRLSVVLRQVFLPAFLLAFLLSAGQDALGETEQFRPRLSINVPTVTFEKIVRSTVPGEVGATALDVIDVPWIANYVAGVYRYATSVATIIAGVMFLVGAFGYLTAGGDASRVSKAKERITNAVIGLALVLGAYVMLLTINPDLVSLTSLQIRTVAKKTFVTITPSAYQQVTGVPPPPSGSGSGPGGTGGTSAGGTGMFGMAMEAARATGIPELPCFVKASMMEESGGKANALGHDENAATTVFSVGARRQFINSGVFKSGATFPPVGCNDKSCQNQGPRANDDGFNADAPPDYGLDWRYSHGFGSGQSTIFPGSAPCPGNEGQGRGFRMGGHCYSAAQLLNPQTQVQAMVEHYQNCWRRGGGDPARAYVCYAGTIAPDNPIIVKRVNNFNACRAAGG
ncbi:MAG TPA: pilin [Candidatus Eisenbacteria bacterium]|nr:pilin [Candidatus Eisenbacteria bacterium]